MEHAHRQKVDSSGDPYIHFDLADRILDRESLFSASPREFIVCGGWFDHDPMYHTDQHIAQKYATLFYQKRGV